VNPDHLEPVTNAENQRRRNLLKTHCKAGHELAGANLSILASGQRWCRECGRRRSREYVRRQRCA
jgi:hypothetical protein